jgi:hypothetical protein
MRGERSSHSLQTWASSPTEGLHQDKGDGQDDDNAQAAEPEHHLGQSEQGPKHQQQNEEGNADADQDEQLVKGQAKHVSPFAV